MKTKILSYILASILLLSTFSSCNLLDGNGDDGQSQVDHFLVSYEEVSNYSAILIKASLTFASSSYPEIETLIDKVEHGVTVYKITYNTSFKGEDVIASGIVSVPTSEGEYPVLSYQNGTNTLHSDAPSVDYDNTLFQMLESIASTGFIVTFPDYLGFGSTDNMFHPYLDKESTVQTVLDMQRATKELVSNYLDIEMNNDLYITGYSQGGWATMQVQKAIEQQHSAEFNLIASACGAGPYNLNYINEYILDQSEYPMPYYVGYIFNSYINLGLTIATNEIFQEPYDSRVLELYDGTNSGTEINEQLTTTVSDLFTSDFLNNYNTDEKFLPLISMLEENSVTAWKITTPTRLYHGTNDTFVPPMVSNQILLQFQLQGTRPSDVELFPIQGATHQSGIVPTGLASINWFLELKNATEM
ncbi:MAG: prolyl oligopeptidase family serine peptidase [Bacteroidetes bacterium]|nr:prolyl oligopeptidase family serine peptidase [Bacteroidota bacterium]